MKKHLLLAVAIIILAGCVEPQAEKVEERMEVLDVEPIVDYYALGGYTGDAGEGFFVVAGDVDETKAKARAIVTGDAKQKVEFDSDELLNFVVFRGVFPTGGHGLEVERVEKVGNSFVVHATYTDPGKGMMVTEAFTQPAAIIAVGKLPRGSYEARLKVTSIVKDEGVDRIVEEGKEHGSIAFAVE